MKKIINKNNQEITFGSRVFCYVTSSIPIWGGSDSMADSDRLVFTGYVGEVMGIREMANGDVFYTIMPKKLNLHTGKIERVVFPKPFEVSSENCFFNIKDMRRDIYGAIGKIDSFLKGGKENGK